MSAITRAIQISKNQRKTLVDRDITTGEMRHAIEEWFELYYETRVAKDYDSSQRLPYTIVRKLSRTMFGEYKASINGEGVKSENLRTVLESVNKKSKSIVQHGLIGGSVFIKPIPKKDTFSFAVIDRRNYVVLARDEDGNITSCGMSEVTKTENGEYTLEEERTVNADGYLTIINNLYYSDGNSLIGKASRDATDKGKWVPLNTLEKYADLEDTVTLPLPIGSVGLIPFNMPIENCVDGSSDPVSVYACVVELIKGIYRHEAEITQEFDRAKSKIVGSEDVIEFGENGKKSINADIFVGLQANPEDVGIKIFNPNIREENFLNRKNDYLRMVENAMGLKRGILSEIETQEFTATQITSSAGDYNLTIIDLQTAWTECVIEAIRVCDILGQIYLGWDTTEYDEPQLDYGDGVLYNPEEKYQRMKEMSTMGYLKPEYLLGWEFGDDTDTEERLQIIREKYMPKMADVE